MEFITANYWFGWVFGIVASIISAIVVWGIKRSIEKKANEKIAKNEAFEQRMIIKFNEAIDLHDKKLSEADTSIRVDMEVLDNKIETITTGLLSIQGRSFKQDCREML